MQKSFVLFGPVLSILMMWTLVYQPIHRWEHYAQAETEQHCNACCQTKFPVVKTQGDFVVDEKKGDEHYCALCEYEFVYFSQKGHVYLPNKDLFFDKRLIPLNSLFYDCYNAFYKKLRGPPIFSS